MNISRIRGGVDIISVGELNILRWRVFGNHSRNPLTHTHTHTHTHTYTCIKTMNPITTLIKCQRSRIWEKVE